MYVSIEELLQSNNSSIYIQTVNKNEKWNVILSFKASKYMEKFDNKARKKKINKI